MPTIRVPGTFKELARVREFAAEAAEAAGFGPSDVYAVRLAVEEACANIIEHSYGGESIGEIVCTCETSSAGVTIYLRDWGQPFDPETVPPPDIDKPIEEVRLRGAGLFLMRRLMDDVAFDFASGDGNLLIMRKRKSR